MEIGIIGQGFVGSAVREGLKEHYSIKTYDINPDLCNSTHADLAYFCNIIFVCVPTPMKKTGECDISILRDVLLKLDYAVGENRPTIVIKSTIPPGTTDLLRYRCKNIDLCFSPEFLTEANSFDDFKNQNRIIIGGNGAIVKQMFRKPFPDIPIMITTSLVAEMVKYFTNCFLATKVIFANEMYKICQAAQIDYNFVIKLAKLDSRIGESHLKVPGPDGDFGFGGHCFPKDMEALVYFSEEHECEPSFLKSVLDENDKVRKNRDWETMKGRAISGE